MSSGLNFPWCYHQLQPSHVLSHAPLQLDNEIAYVSSITSNTNKSLYFALALFVGTQNQQIQCSQCY